MRLADSIGARTAAQRKLRGLTQQQLAARAHVSYSLVSKVEAGDVPASPAFVSAVARALGLSVSELQGQPYRGATAKEDQAHATISELRRELIAYNVPIDDDAPQPRPVADLQAAVAAASGLRHRADFVGLGQLVPGLLAELRIAIAHAVDERESQLLYGLLAETYYAAGQLAWALGYVDLSSMTVDRYEWAAARSGDPLAVAVGDSRRAGELRIAGDPVGAERVVTAALRRLEPALAGHPSPPALAIWGHLHLNAALIAARTANASSAWTHLGEARTAANRIGDDRDDYRLCFGPTNVGIWSVSLAVELADGASAVKHAANLRIPRGTQPERVGHHHIDLARGQLYHGDRQGALRSLQTARRIAPQQARNHPMVRETLHALARSERRSNQTLRSLAVWVGLED